MRDPNPLRWIEAAKAGGYAVGAFNMHNDETAQALLQAAVLADSPVYMQVGRAIIPHMGLKKAYELTVRNGEESDARYTIHLDHGTWDEVLLATVRGEHQGHQAGGGALPRLRHSGGGRAGQDPGCRRSGRLVVLLH